MYFSYYLVPFSVREGHQETFKGTTVDKTGDNVHKGQRQVQENKRKNMAEHNELGSLGEEMVEKALFNKGFSILARNYRKKWGELDIVVHKDKVVHIIEVKTVTRRSIGGEFPEYKDQYRPEDNLHPNKQKRLKRAINSFFLEKFNGYPEKWQFDLACVYIDPISKISKIVYSNNIIL